MVWQEMILNYFWLIFIKQSAHVFHSIYSEKVWRYQRRKSYYCPIMCLYVLSSMVWCSLLFLYKNDVRFVFVWGLMSYLRYLCLFGSSLYDGSCLIYVICVCLRVVMSNTYCVVFLFCLSSSCVFSFSGLSIFYFPFVIL